ncbi:MAG: precorrin-6B methylase [Lachnospiraceae bacterium]|nr:precorrin-6B methylase [Lachnospiraceae bacterium]
MEANLFNNTHILAWLQYFAENSEVDLEKVKLLDITKKNKNLIPTVESHGAVLVFTEAGHPDIFYKMFNAGLGDCEVVYNEGSDPAGPIKRNHVYDMINRGINASAGMLILNPKARTTYKFGMNNSIFTPGSVHYVGSEVRSILLSKMQIAVQTTVCVISGASIAIESAMLATEGSIIAVEYSARDRRTLEDNVNQFGVNNVTIIDHVDEETMKDLPVPDVTMLVASASMEQEMKYLLSINPNMRFVIYTLDVSVMAGMRDIFRELGVKDPEIIQAQISRLTSKNTFEIQPAPWIIIGQAGEEPPTDQVVFPEVF